MKKQTKVPYTDADADAAILAHNLAPSVKKVWKTRGHIPGAYFDPVGLDNTPRLSDHDPEYRKFLEILNMPEVAASKFRSLGQKGSDVAREKDRMSEADRIGFKTEITEVRNKFARAIKTPTEGAIKAALADIRIKPTITIGVKLYTRVMSAKPLTDAEKEDIRIQLARVYNQLRV